MQTPNWNTTNNEYVGGQKSVNNEANFFINSLIR